MPIRLALVIALGGVVGVTCVNPIADRWGTLAGFAFMAAVSIAAALLVEAV